MSLTKANVDYHEVMQWLNGVHLPEVDTSIATSAGGYLDTPYASLSAAVTAIGSTVATLRISTPLFPNGATVTVPSTLTLEFVSGGTLTVATSQTVTIQGPLIAPPRKIFYNALASQGTILWTDNHKIDGVFPQWWGALADGSTDDTASIQAASTSLDSSNIDGTVWFPAGIYVIAGALQDTGASNAQLILPKRTTQLTQRWAGLTPAPTIASTKNTTGTVLKSTLSSGTGNVIGVKGSFTIGGVPNNTALSFQLENLIVQTVADPTNSAIDLFYVPNVRIANVQIGTGDATTSISEPTTSTSYGLKLSPHQVPDLALIDNVQIYGFYNLMKCGELTHVRDFIGTFYKVGLEIPGANHPYLFERVWLGHGPSAIKFTGGTGDATVRFTQLVIEHQSSPAWVTNTTDIVDGSNIAQGTIEFALIGASGPYDSLVVTGCGKVLLHQTRKPWLSRHNYAVSFSGFDTQDNAVHEINRRITTSNDNNHAALNLVTDQSGTSHSVGRILFVNQGLGTEKRIAQILCKTSGATNSGIVYFTIWNAGSAIDAFWLNDKGVCNTLLHAQEEGSVLSVSGNAIAPTRGIHHVGAGLIKNITVPTGFSSGVLHVIPDAAFTTDATGNIGLATTATVGRTMDFVYSSSSSKWYPSY